MTKTIALSQGKVALVDDQDFGWLNQWKWYCGVSRKPTRTKYYAVRNTTLNGRRKWTAMHRVITNAAKGCLVDHANGDGLDNRRANLRICTPAENLLNRRKTLGTSSRYKGVSWNKQKQKWVAYIHRHKDYIHLGSHDSECEAARVYDEAAQREFGPLALLNGV